MSQYHKTTHYVQHAIRMYIDANKTLEANLYEGGAYEKADLPAVFIMLAQQSTENNGYGSLGNKQSIVNIQLQTGGSKTEEQHWDLWAEIEDLFNVKTAALCACLNEYVPEINFQYASLTDMVNTANGNVRVTTVSLEVHTNINT